MKLKTFVKRLKTRQKYDTMDIFNVKFKAMEEYCEKLEERIIQLEEFVEGAKSVVKETKRMSDNEKYKKWLRGNPDETSKGV